MSELKDEYWTNSMCSVAAQIIEDELKKDSTNEDKCFKYLKWIKRNCHEQPFKPGEIPEHLKEYLFEKEKQ